MKRNFLLVFATVFVCAMMFCLACGGEDSGDTQKVELEVQLFKNLCTHKAQKYPEDIQSLSKPLKDIGESKANWAFYPFSLKRVDLNKTAKLNYLDNRAGNDKKINFVVREHRQFFEENTVDTLLVSSKMEGVNISEVLNNS
ncbi:MAG: hypothetical protein Q8K92_12930, partial [Leadbetterella sp.]|nr:hypothetical protein [Leadbetterella sp.]